MKRYFCDVCDNPIPEATRIAQTTWMPGIAGVLVNHMDLCPECLHKAQYINWKEIVIDIIEHKDPEDCTGMPEDNTDG